MAISAFAMAAGSPPLDSCATGYPPAAENFGSRDPLKLASSGSPKAGTIYLRSGPFDPVEEGLPSLDQSEKDGVRGAPADAFIVQFRDELPRAERDILERYGVDLIEYIPSHAYIIRADNSALGSLSRWDNIRWIGRLKCDFKLDPILLQGGWAQDAALDLTLFPGTNPWILLKRLQAAFPTISFASLNGSEESRFRLRLVVPSGLLSAFSTAAAEDPGVLSVSPWFLPHSMNDYSVYVVQSYDTANKTSYPICGTIWNHGLTGTGQTPAVCDTGCDDDMCYFRLSSDPSQVTDAQYPALPGTGTISPGKKVAAYYVLPGASAYDGSFTCGGGFVHGTHVSGSLLGDNFLTPSTPSTGSHDTGDGMAPNARLILQDAGKENTGCLDGLANDYNLIFQQAYDAGARIHSNSWGNDLYGVYDADCQLVDRFIYRHEDLQFFFANGNMGSGSNSVGSPASAKNCVAVGATWHGSTGSNTIAVFSSRGPTDDGRIKPDICAPGYSIISAYGDSNHWDANCGTTSKSGTSMATPTAAGAATLLRQYFTDGFYPTGAASASDGLEPSAALLKAALVNGAVDISHLSQSAVLNSLTPDNNQGFGRILLDTVCFFSAPSRDSRRLRLWDKKNATGLSTGETDEFTLQIAAGQPLKVTLTWTDPESTSLAAVNLVNNLDLEVLDPSDNIYKGNYFSGGQSALGGTADSINNVEEVFIVNQTAGTWKVRVKATSVPGTPLEEYSDRQGYALVATYADCQSSLSPPPSFSATDLGAAGISLSWGSVAGAALYQIYRASGNCPSGSGAFSYLGNTSALTFTDSLVDGGFTYSYSVRAADGCSEGPASQCASATSSGNCALLPSFAGIAAAANDYSTNVCDILLSWPAAVSNCPLAPSVSFNIYRGTDPYFSPGISNRIATGLQSLGYRDSDLPSNETLYYIVRAEDGTTGNGGPANGGNEDQNSLRLSATPASSGFESGSWSDGGGDSGSFLDLGYPWTVTNQQNHTPSGAFAYHSAMDSSTYTANTCAAAVTPEIPLQAGQAPILSYWVRYNIEYRYDGLVVEISTDGGSSWSAITPAQGYPGNFGLTGSPPINACLYPATGGCFTGPSGNGALSAWTQYTHDLTAYAGATVKVRWRLSTDSGANYEGLYLDDIQITSAGTPRSCTTADGLLYLDKGSCDCGEALTVTAIDPDMAGSGTLPATARSTAEPGGESVSLAETPSGSGSFSGTLVTTSAAPSADGLLSVGNGDTVRVIYLDADDGHGGSDVEIWATAAISCVPPPETAPGTSIDSAQYWTGKDQTGWPANPKASSYKLYRGTRADLPSLLNLGVDSCLRYSGAAHYSPASEDPLQEAGRFYWFVVTGLNGAGEGTAGSATEGNRSANDGGACP